MKRRDVLTMLGGAATALPLAARAAQPPAPPVIGFVSGRTEAESGFALAAFRDGLAFAGYRTAVIETRWADGDLDRVPALTGELLGRTIAVLAAVEGAQLPAAAKARGVPIVAIVDDAIVESGLVANFNRPGGNVTGLYLMPQPLEQKRLALLRGLLPQDTLIAVLANPNGATVERQEQALRTAAQQLGQRIEIFRSASDRAIDAAYDRLVAAGAVAVQVTDDPFFAGHRAQLLSLAARHRLPAIYPSRDFVAAGGLMSYGNNMEEAYRQLGRTAGEVLAGVSPATLPVQPATRLALTINARTAKALGLVLPPTLLAVADEVIG